MRAQRSNPESLRGGSLDCFAALAMTLLRERAMPTPTSSWTSSRSERRSRTHYPKEWFGEDSWLPASCRNFSLG
ncbi:hypothetical protein EI171_05180 [Bradyrhizobium sp. LCT2]|nr:hypothetical protein EI171_05180 [Bradyrhizobium sp. LCT2]